MMYKIIMGDQTNTELGMTIFPLEQHYWYHPQLKCAAADLLLNLTLLSKSQGKYMVFENV